MKQRMKCFLLGLTSCFKNTRLKQEKVSSNRSTVSNHKNMFSLLSLAWDGWIPAKNAIKKKSSELKTLSPASNLCLRLVKQRFSFYTTFQSEDLLKLQLLWSFKHLRYLMMSQFSDVCRCFIFIVTSNHQIVVTSTQSLEDVHKQYSHKCKEAESLSQSQNDKMQCFLLFSIVSSFLIIKRAIRLQRRAVGQLEVVDCLYMFCSVHII